MWVRFLYPTRRPFFSAQTKQEEPGQAGYCQIDIDDKKVACSTPHMGLTIAWKSIDRIDICDRYIRFLGSVGTIQIPRRVFESTEAFERVNTLVNEYHRAESSV
jgi:hypothetical protein